MKVEFDCRCNQLCKHSGHMNSFCSNFRACEPCILQAWSLFLSLSLLFDKSLITAWYFYVCMYVFLCTSVQSSPVSLLLFLLWNQSAQKDLYMFCCYSKLFEARCFIKKGIYLADLDVQENELASSGFWWRPLLFTHVIVKVATV